MEDQNKTPRTGGGSNLITPKTGGGDRNKTPGGPGSMSAPSDAPAVRDGVTIPKSGDPYTPTSMKMDQKVDPVQPPKGSNR